MGKLKDSLSASKTLLSAIDTRLKEAEDVATKLDTNLQSRYEAGIKAGAEVLYSYLVEKFKEAKDSYDNHLKDPLLQHKDANVLKFVGGIAQGKSDVEKVFLAWEAFKAKELKSIAGDLDRLDAYADDIGKMIDKKRKRLLQSTKFKTKMKDYDNTLLEVRQATKKLRDGLAEFRPCMNKKAIDAIKLSVSTTLGELSQDSLLIGLKTELKNAASAAKAGVQTRRKAREGGDLAGAALMFAKWVQDAEGIEAEAEEDTPPKEPNPKPTITAIVIKQGSTVVAEAKSGVYERKTKTLVADCTWKVKGADPLSYLQKKFSVQGAFEDKSEGTFTSDMKLDKLLGNLIKATFKG